MARAPRTNRQLLDEAGLSPLTVDERREAFSDAAAQLEARRQPRGSQRPLHPTPALLARLTAALSDGRSLLEIAQTAMWAPTRFTMARWMTEYPEFAEIVQTARVMEAMRCADEVRGIVDAEPHKREDGSIDPASVRLMEVRAAQRWRIMERIQHDVWGAKDSKTINANLVVRRAAPERLEDVMNEVVRISGELGAPLQIIDVESEEVEE